MSKTKWVNCPFCNGKIRADNDNEPPAMYHTVPPCNEFCKDEDALEFIQRVNAAYCIYN